MKVFKNVKVILENEILEDALVTVENGKIAGIHKSLDITPDMEVIDGEGNYLSPGFIDLHVHGGGGYSAMTGRAQDIIEMSRAHARYGTTSILPTTLAAPIAQLKTAIDGIRAAKEICTCSNILGAHLEGPFFSKKFSGAQNPENLIVPAETDYEDLLDYWNGIRIMGAAPETDGAMELGHALTKRGIVASIAHTAADYDTAMQAVENGYSDVTHLYNACSSCFKVGVFRVAGVVEAALVSDKLTTQVIADLRHQPVGVLKLIYKCKGSDKMYLITDGLEYSAAELEEGQTLMQENGMAFVYEDGVMKLADRSCLAGSAATSNRLVRNMYKTVGVSLCEAVKMMSYTPARVVGLGDSKGKIAEGYDADLLLFDDNIDMKMVMVMGNIVSFAE